MLVHVDDRRGLAVEAILHHRVVHLAENPEANRRAAPLDLVLVVGGVGVRDRFGESGKPDELIEAFGMGVGSIKEAVKKSIS